jgi:hypothetical protein
MDSEAANRGETSRKTAGKDTPLQSLHFVQNTFGAKYIRQIAKLQGKDCT